MDVCAPLNSWLAAKQHGHCVHVGIAAMKYEICCKFMLELQVRHYFGSAKVFDGIWKT
jgi:hypothetical protein